MMTGKHFNNAIMLVLSLLFLASCSKEEEEEQAQINLVFEHYVGGIPLEFNEIKYTSKFGNTYSVATLRYFVSDFRLQMENGDAVTLGLEHYIDARDPSTSFFTPGLTIPQGGYSSVSFVLGLNEEKNVSGRFPNPPENNMEWPPPLGSGYHYMKLEGKFREGDTVRNFQAHTGPTFGNANFINILLDDASFIVAGKEITLTFRMDINQWWQEPNTFDLDEMTMIMGNQEMQQKMHDNGMNVFTFVKAE